MKYSELEIRINLWRKKTTTTKPTKTKTKELITHNYLRRTEQLKFEMSK